MTAPSEPTGARPEQFAPRSIGLLCLLVGILIPLIPGFSAWADSFCPIVIYGILVCGLHVVTGDTGTLHLGVAAFMALGAYSFSIATCHIYPFQLPWIVALAIAAGFSGLCGLILGIPVLRLRGDYLAIVTLGFGEIVQDSLRNLEVITKGTQGINPIPAPNVLGIAFEEASKQYWYLLLVTILLVSIWLLRTLERSSSGRAWAAIRDNELAARCVGIQVDRAKVRAMVISSALCGMAGGLWVSFLGSSGEPGTYDFQVSVVVLCGLILGGLGTLWGALVGTMIMVGLNSLVLTKLTQWMTAAGLASTTTVWASPTNWKYLIFGSALILMMRYRPAGLFPEELRR